jgi:hypothetical protein
VAPDLDLTEMAVRAWLQRARANPPSARRAWRPANDVWRAMIPRTPRLQSGPLARPTTQKAGAAAS